MNNNFNNPYNGSGNDNQNNNPNNTGAPNPYANNAPSLNNSSYNNDNNAVVPNSYANNVPNLNKNPYNNNYNNTGAPNPYANNVPNPNNAPYNNADAQTYYANNFAPNQYNNYNNPSMPIPPNGMPDQSWYSPQKETKKNVIIIVLIILIPIIAILGFIGIILGIVFGTLNTVKNSEEYDVAYSYVVNSDTFDKLNAEEDDIKFTGFTTEAKIIVNGDSHSSKSEYTFRVKGSELTVVCHKDKAEKCYVCEECTEFD